VLPTARPPVFGDVNCDRLVDSRDALLILQYVTRLLRAFGCQAGADVNGDGEINVIDAALVLQYDAGLIGHLPVTAGVKVERPRGSWGGPRRRISGIW
jgi:hypothetical protein